MTTTPNAAPATLSALDDATRRLVQVAAVVAAGTESQVREALAAAAPTVPHLWIEELLLQTYLFAGFPRALNAFREWRRHAPEPVDAAAVGEAALVPGEQAAEWAARGRDTCRAVYGAMYGKLRVNIEALHPALDAWMIVEGYGKVLSRPGLDLPRRELCIVAACASSGQDRQLHSHLHGALNVGVLPDVVRAALASLDSVVAGERLAAARLLLERVIGK